MNDDLIKRLRDMMYRVSRNDAEILGEIATALTAPVAEEAAQVVARDEASVALTEDRIIEIAYECDLAPIAPESTCLDFARRILSE